MTNYPFAGSAPYPRNQWYLAAWSSEVGRVPLGRTILDQPMVFYRTVDGRAVALSGICPHRWMPLARGRLHGDLLRCAYHGLAFGADGSCRGTPGGRPAPDACRLLVFPLVERAPCLWLWPGDAARADAKRIPDIAGLGLDAPGWNATLDPPMAVRARAQIILENLFDQSHIASVHAKSLGGGSPLPEPADLAVEDTPQRLRFGHNLPLAPVDRAVRALFPTAGSFVRTRLHCELFGVALVNSVGSHTFNSDIGGAFLDPLGRINFVHGITPETPHSTHYFTALTRDFDPADPTVSAALVERNRTVIGEDIAILEALEPMLDAHADPRAEISFASDAMAMRLRRRIGRLIRAESGALPSPPVADPG